MLNRLLNRFDSNKSRENRWIETEYKEIWFVTMYNLNNTQVTLRSWRKKYIEQNKETLYYTVSLCSFLSLRFGGS